MEYPDDTISYTITCETLDICKCITNINYYYSDVYYCYCDGENVLLDKLKAIGANNLKPYTHYGAARNGHLNVLKWLYLHSVSFILNKNDPHDKNDRRVWCNICLCAASNNHLNILKWVHSQNKLFTLFDVNPVPYDHLNIYKWLIKEYECIIMNREDMWEINIHCLEYLFEINKTDMIKNKINLQQIERLKILASGVF